MSSRKYDVPFWPKWVRDTIITVLVLVGLILVVSSLTGCSSAQPYGEAQHTVSGTLTTTAHDAPETDTFDLSPQAAKLKIKLAKIRADVEKTKAKAQAKAEAAKAQAANPCASWLMAPSYCYTNGVYSSGGSNTSYGTNVVYRTY